MKIKIIGASDMYVWYFVYIFHSFDVEKENDEAYYVLDHSTNILRPVHKKDAVIL